MRPQHMLRVASPAGLAGALSAITLVAAAPAAAQSDTPGAIAPVQVTVKDRSLGYGKKVVVDGRLASGQAGVPVVLQFRPAQATSWQSRGSATTGADGRFRLRAALRRSGRVRVVDAAATARSAQSAAAEPVAEIASAERTVRVGARIAPHGVRHHLPAGRAWTVAGAVRPGGRGRRVSLQLRRAGRWRTVDRARTSAAGRFALRTRLAGAMSAAARVRFAGDRTNAASQRSLGRVNAYRSAVASWYGPGLYGNPLGCGGRLTTATVGVAHKTLPCGTRLTLRYRGRTVRVRVIDRGPFVAGREFDLTAATKNRLRFGSTGTIQVTR